MIEGIEKFNSKKDVEEWLKEQFHPVFFVNKKRSDDGVDFFALFQGALAAFSVYYRGRPDAREVDNLGVLDNQKVPIFCIGVMPNSTRIKIWCFNDGYNWDDADKGLEIENAADLWEYTGKKIKGIK